jgi:phosphoribosyl-ATP pyrophosphohydrolase/phosphoribosyl-AMP cyclohydrolase
VSCFETEARPTGFLGELEEIIADRLSGSDENSYTRKLVSKGIHKVAQKVGEEGVEVVIEALRNDDDLFLGESADLLFHLLVLLQAKGKKLSDVEAVLRERHAARK